MIRYKQLVTLKIIDKENRQPIGKILDLIYSHDYKKVAYIVVKNNNLIKNKAPIPYENINFLNSNQGLYLDNIQVFEEQLEEVIEEFQFIDKEVRGEDGESIGYIKDLVINKEDGSIGGFIITEGVIEDLIKGRNYIPLLENIIIKDEFITVPSDIFN